MKLDIRQLMKMPPAVFDTPPTHDELEELWDDSANDIHIGPLGGAWHQDQCIAFAGEDGPDAQAIQAWMDSRCYWPNIWRSDRYDSRALCVIQDGELVMIGGLV